MCAKCSLEWTLRTHQWLKQFVWHLRTMRTCNQSTLRKFALDSSGAGRNCQNAFKQISKRLKLFLSTDVGQLCVTVKWNCINSVNVMTEQFLQSSVVFRFWDTVRVMCKQRWSGFLSCALIIIILLMQAFKGLKAKAKAKDHPQGRDQGQGLRSQGQGRGQGLEVSRPRPRTWILALRTKAKAKD